MNSTAGYSQHSQELDASSKLHGQSSMQDYVNQMIKEMQAQIEESFQPLDKQCSVLAQIEPARHIYCV